MNKSKKNYKNTIKRIRKEIKNKSRKFIKKLNKTTKNKSNFKKCENFCKKDYMIEMNKVYKKSSEKYNIPYELPRKQDNELFYNSCKKTFCNEKCEGYDFFGDKKKQIEYKKKIKNGFQDTYSRTKIEMLKKRGALSGCVDIPEYNIFHK
jgi:hypothetical protein